MESSNPYYEEWKKTATYSNGFMRKTREEEQYKRNKENFFGCGEIDWQRRKELIEANKQPDPKSLVKTQFMLDKTQAQSPLNKYEGSDHFKTSNQFFQNQTMKSSQQLRETISTFQQTIGQLHPSVIEVSAKRTAPIWKTEQQKDDNFRKMLNSTISRQVFQYDTEIAQKLRCNKHNIRVTNISEYSNAINRGSVFINPKFQSC